jgi:hypothetical protein
MESTRSSDEDTSGFDDTGSFAGKLATVGVHLDDDRLDYICPRDGQKLRVNLAEQWYKCSYCRIKGRGSLALAHDLAAFGIPITSAERQLLDASPPKSCPSIAAIHHRGAGGLKTTYVDCKSPRCPACGIVWLRDNLAHYLPAIQAQPMFRRTVQRARWRTLAKQIETKGGLYLRCPLTGSEEAIWTTVPLDSPDDYVPEEFVIEALATDLAANVNEAGRTRRISSSRAWTRSVNATPTEQTKWERVYYDTTHDEREALIAEHNMEYTAYGHTEIVSHPEAGVLRDFEIAAGLKTEDQVTAEKAALDAFAARHPYTPRRYREALAAGPREHRDDDSEDGTSTPDL